MHKFFQTAMLAIAAILVLSGCGPSTLVQSADAAHHTPPPVTDHGMTLDWSADVKTQALGMIQSCQRFCWLDIYELSDPEIMQGLIAARRRGVDVRVIVDATEPHSQEVAVPHLRQAGVPVASLRIHRGISHLKMLLADGPHGGVLIGGMNFGENSWQNNDASVYLPNPNPSFAALFRWDWQRSHGNPAAAPSAQEPLVNDRALSNDIVRAINQATTSICMEAFNLSDRRVLNALTAASRRGVLVEVLLDPNQAQNRQTAQTLRNNGATVRFYRPYATEWMHAKILDVDNGRTIFIGSANFSHQAYLYNHEADIELHTCPLFSKSIEENLAAQVARGTDYPTHHGHW